MSAVRMRRTLGIKGADAVMAAAENEAMRSGYRVVIAIVDAWGNLLQLRRTENAQAASVQVAIDKARTAAIFVRPSRVNRRAGQLGASRGARTARGRSLTGGIPLTAGDEVIGAIGTSGETPDQDESVSLAGPTRHSASPRSPR
jgi:glc operon protein GlcG